MFGQLEREVRDVFEIYYDGMAEIERSTFLQSTKNNFSALTTVHGFGELKDQYALSLKPTPARVVPGCLLDQGYDWLVLGKSLRPYVGVENEPYLVTSPSQRRAQLRPRINTDIARNEVQSKQQN